MNNRTDLEDMQRRLISLEGQNRKLKQIGTAALILVGSILLMAQASPKDIPTKTVEANEFVLKDDSGQIRARLEMYREPTASPNYPKEPRLSFFDANGLRRVIVNGGSFMPGLSVNDDQGQSRISVTENDFADLGAILMLQDKDGRVQARLGADGMVTTGQLSAPRIEGREFILKDVDWNTRARLFMTEQSTATVAELFGNTTPPGANNTSVTFTAKPMLALYDERGQTRGMIDDDSITFIKSQASLAGGILSISDGQKNGVVISPYSVGLFDEQGFEASLGRRALITPRTGEKQMRSAASLVMFDNYKNVIWKAP